MVLVAQSFMQLPLAYAKNQSADPAAVRPKSSRMPHPYVGSGADFSTDTLSVEAMQLAKQLKLTDRLQELERLAQQSKANNSEKPALEQRVQLLELKEELSEALEQTRLEIEYVRSAIAAEAAIQGELVRSYTEQRDNRVFQNNLWSFRTNGVLWTLAEALSIPTYSHPRYCVSSGTLGILAGLVPTAFSLVALKQSQGGKIERRKAPNMFCKIFDYPVAPAIDYPPSVWDFLNSVPPRRKNGKTRLNILIDQWMEDKNINILSDRKSKSQLDLLTGSVEQHLSIDLMGDRVTMLSQLDALVSLMNRPLLELMLAVRGSKHLSPDSSN